MPSEKLQSHLVTAQSVEQALASVENRLDKLNLPVLEQKLGSSLAALMRATEAEPEARWALRFSNEKAFLLSLAEDAAKSEFGRFLLCARGLNWRTTDLLFDPAYQATLRRQERDGSLCFFDRLAFFACPLFLATRERFGIFQRHTQPLVAEGASLASLPCGRMRDLLSLDYSRIVRGIRLVGLDKDPEALQGAQIFAAEVQAQKPLHGTIEFRVSDGLRPGLTEAGIRREFDLVTSNGLNIYLNDDQCVTFYRHVQEALKPGGTFITSHIVPTDEYRWDQINRDHWRLQAVILTVLIGALWEPRVKPRGLVQEQLETAGFREIRVFPDAQGIFPTFVAKKPH
ncbi:MAG: methyltransferase domain-containing protein [Nitrospirota bacterium]|nr:methyltransferase domain-containing protein [Nitrospirota bacterium]MDE3117394.1 methyltransferase domain-containing protein [Nitrospirota bacterium]